MTNNAACNKTQNPMELLYSAVRYIYIYIYIYSVKGGAHLTAKQIQT